MDEGEMEDSERMGEEPPEDEAAEKVAESSAGSPSSSSCAIASAKFPKKSIARTHLLDDGLRPPGARDLLSDIEDPADAEVAQRRWIPRVLLAAEEDAGKDLARTALVGVGLVVVGHARFAVATNEPDRIGAA
jgi:hypothetical protein